VFQAYLADIFHELNFLNSRMQGRNENALTSTNKLAFLKKLTVWRNCASTGTLKPFLLLWKEFIHCYWIIWILCWHASGNSSVYICWIVQPG